MSKFFTIIIIFILLGCSNIKRDWQNSNKIEDNLYKIRVGDIIITEKSNDYLSWFGHCGIVVDHFYVAEIPKLNTNLMFSSIQEWIGKDKNVVVLRLKNVSEEFRDDLLREIYKHRNKPYTLTLNKNSTKGFYCSQFIWIVYKNTAKKHNMKLNLDSDGGIIVLPYDILYSEELEEIKLIN